LWVKWSHLQPEKLILLYWRLWLRCIFTSEENFRNGGHSRKKQKKFIYFGFQILSFTNILWYISGERLGRGGDLAPFLNPPLLEIFLATYWARICILLKNKSTCTIYKFEVWYRPHRNDQMEDNDIEICCILICFIWDALFCRFVPIWDTHSRVSRVQPPKDQRHSCHVRGMYNYGDCSPCSCSYSCLFYIIYICTLI
jgi:hypothetical protein